MISLRFSGLKFEIDFSFHIIFLFAFCMLGDPKSCSRDHVATAEDNVSDVIKLEGRTPKDLDRNEFILVEMLNRCRQLLWQNGDYPLEAFFSNENPYNEVSNKRLAYIFVGKFLSLCLV